MRQPVIVIPQIGDKFAVWRDYGSKVWSVPTNNKRALTGCKIYTIDFRFNRIQLAIRVIIANHQQAVVIKPGGKLKRRRTACDLSRRTTLSGYDKHLACPLFQIATPIKTKLQRIEDANRLGPGCALWRLHWLRKFWRISGWNKHAKCNLATVR